jgi:uncharacterized membrane protein YeaQ/YmgE (transglycosylase-associated protein family)
MSLIVTLIIGGLAGWLAGTIMRGGGFGIPMNVLIGVVGSVVGNLLLGLLGLSAFGLVGRLIAATLGAIVILYVADYASRRRGGVTARRP